MVSQTDRGRHHEAVRVAVAGLLCLSGLTGTLLLANAIGVPPWVTVPGALTLAVVWGFLLGARASER